MPDEFLIAIEPFVTWMAVLGGPIAILSVGLFFATIGRFIFSLVVVGLS